MGCAAVEKEIELPRESEEDRKRDGGQHSYANRPTDWTDRTDRVDPSFSGPALTLISFRLWHTIIHSRLPSRDPDS